MYGEGVESDFLAPPNAHERVEGYSGASSELRSIDVYCDDCGAAPGFKCWAGGGFGSKCGTHSSRYKKAAARNHDHRLRKASCADCKAGRWHKHIGP